jgi:hypothetical protein
LPPFAVGRKLRIALPSPMTQFQLVKCTEHQAEAIGICAYCGRAVCAGCANSSGTPRLVCSPGCAAALSRNDQVLQLLLHKAAQNAQASAFYCYLCGGLSLGAAASGIVFILSGAWYGWTARRHVSRP